MKEPVGLRRQGHKIAMFSEKLLKKRKAVDQAIPNHPDRLLRKAGSVAACTAASSHSIYETRSPSQNTDHQPSKSVFLGEASEIDVTSDRT